MSAPVKLPSQERLNELFIYQPTVGVLRWKVRPHGRCKRRAGDIAGSLHISGGIQVVIDGVAYRAHRIIWKLVYGTEPSEIDHINGNPRDNQLTNLRAATRSENSRNRRVMKNNKLGLKGVIRTESGRYLAQIDVDGRRVKLGYFDSPEEARMAYVVRAKLEHGAFVHSSVSEEAQRAVMLPVTRRGVKTVA